MSSRERITEVVVWRRISVNHVLADEAGCGNFGGKKVHS